MSTTAELSYSVTFGRCDGSDGLEWDMELEGEAERAYLRAWKYRLPYDDFPILQKVLEDAYREIEEYETNQYCEDPADDFVLDCQGLVPVSAEEINDLIAERAPHALAFFGLTGLSEEELDRWDAGKLEKRPNRRDFEEDFEPISPFEAGWDLEVCFVAEPDTEDLYEGEALETLEALLAEAKGDYSEVYDYIERCADLYQEGDLSELAEKVAEMLHIDGFEAE